jgi:hypothetical protein
MSRDIIAVRPSRKHAVFPMANLSMLATTIHQAMTRHGFDADRPAARGTLTPLLQVIEDVVHGAPWKGPLHAGKSAGRTENGRPWRNLGRLSAA